MDHASRIGTPLAKLFSHYHAVLGSPEAVFQVPQGEVEGKEQGQGIAADILIYQPPQLPFDLFITLGVSLHSQQEGEGGRVEYYSKVRKGLSVEQQKEFARSLWLLAQWPFRSKRLQPMTAWHTLGGLRPLIQGSRYEGFLMKPAPGSDAPIQALQKELGGTQILEAVGITLEEFLQLHVTAVEPQEHLIHVKKFVTDRVKEPVILDLLSGETPTFH